MESIMTRKHSNKESGQSMMEYILVVFLVVTAVLFAFGWLRERDFIFKQIAAPVVAFIKYNYKYGDKDALGWDEPRGPKKHAQISKPDPDGSNFRIFIPSDN